MSERYVLVEVNILRVNPRSIIVEGDDGDVVVGRSCIHGADEGQLDRLKLPQKIELRIFEWLARKENLL